MSIALCKLLEWPAVGLCDLEGQACYKFALCANHRHHSLTPVKLRQWAELVELYTS